jgi:hypothetical protein
MADEGHTSTIEHTTKPNEYKVFNQKHDLVGFIDWNDKWNCFVFMPLERMQFGPAFTSDITTKLITLEAKKRKKKGEK